MPYTVDSQDLPDNVKALSDTKRRQWVNVFNSALSRCEKRNGSDCEAAASRQANGVVFEEMALFTPPAETGIEGPISALAASMLTGGVGATSEWARKIVRKLDESREVTMDILQEATWSRKFINDLPDSSFLYIESGGKKMMGARLHRVAYACFHIRTVRARWTSLTCAMPWLASLKATALTPPQKSA